MCHAIPATRPPSSLLALAARSLVTAAGARPSRASRPSAFAKKIALIQRSAGAGVAERRRAPHDRLTEDELNSWFVYRAQPVLPDGRHAAAGHDRRRRARVAAQATVDLDAVGKRRASGGASIPGACSAAGCR